MIQEDWDLILLSKMGGPIDEAYIFTFGTPAACTKEEACAKACGNYLASSRLLMLP
jgi:hypothetical protein